MTALPSDKKKADRIDLKLFNAIAIHDVYVVARDSEAARAALIASIADGTKPTEITATEVTRQGSIRNSWLDQPPFVAGDVTDAEFEALKGITVGAAFSRFYEKRG